MHVHAAPDFYPRRIDEIDLVRSARSVGMRGVMTKSHHTLTADRAWLLKKIGCGIEVFGSLTLNIPATGGFNREAVETAIKLGAKEIWMPTISSANHFRQVGKNESKGLSILTRKDELVSELVDILILIADADIIVGTGHLSPYESEILVDEAKDLGVRKILITHPEWSLVNMPIEVQIGLAKKGALMEHCYFTTTKLGGSLKPQELARQIRSVGAEYCIMSTDLGQMENPYPVDGMADFIRKMMDQGISRSDISKMTKENPAKLLNL